MEKSNQSAYKSSHTFLFAFKWNLNQTDKAADISVVEHLIDLNFWEKYQFKFKVENEFNTFNDYSYFYEPVRDILNLEINNQVIDYLQFQYKGLTSESEFCINLIEGIKLSLEIEDITLNFYENGIGLFCFHLNNYATKDFNQILKINEYGRRIYPQFLGTNEPFTASTKYNFLADSISLNNVPSTFAEIKENFEIYNDLNALKGGYFKLPNHIKCLLGDNFGGTFESEKNAKVTIRPIFDDRMFVICQLLDDDLLVEMKKYNEVDEQYAYQKSTKWYRFLYVDDSTASCTSKTMLKKQLTEQSYDRWLESERVIERKIEHAGQLYGISRYSFMLLTGESEFTRNIIAKHMKSVYFEMVMLCLLQRAYIAYFGNEVARISKQLRSTNDDLSKSRDDISQLYLMYIKFENRIYFREITCQEQGIELYKLLQDTMRIPEDVADLDREIQELNNYIETIEQSHLNRVANWFLPVTLFTGILGMNSLTNDYLDEYPNAKASLKFAVVFFSVIAIGWSIGVFYKQYVPKLKKLWNRIL